MSDLAFDDVPLPRGLRQTLREIPVGKSLLLTEWEGRSIASSAVLIAKEFKDGRKYKTKTENGGVRVWCFIEEHPA